MPDIVENKTECMNCLMSPGFSAVSLKIGMHKAEKTAQRYSTSTNFDIRLVNILNRLAQILCPLRNEFGDFPISIDSIDYLFPEVGVHLHAHPCHFSSKDHRRGWRQTINETCSDSYRNYYYLQ